jgi:hypothetical protein
MAKIGDIIPQTLKVAVREINGDSRIRGSVHMVSFPHKMSWPFKIFKCCPKKCNDDCFKCSKIRSMHCDECVKEKDICKGVAEKYNKNVNELYQESRIETNRNRQANLNTVQKVKFRPYLIISNNSRILDPYVYGLPIYSMKQKQLEKEDMMRKLKNNEIPTMYYIDKEDQGVSKPSYIDLSFIMPINKNFLFEYKGFIEPQDMQNISDKIEFLLDLNQFSKKKNKVELTNMKRSLESKLILIEKEINDL